MANPWRRKKRRGASNARSSSNSENRKRRGRARLQTAPKELKALPPCHSRQRCLCSVNLSNHRRRRRLRAKLIRPHAKAGLVEPRWAAAAAGTSQLLQMIRLLRLLRVLRAPLLRCRARAPRRKKRPLPSVKRMTLTVGERAGVDNGAAVHSAAKYRRASLRHSRPPSGRERRSRLYH